MSKIKYDGFELDYFDKAFNFRKYQIFLIKKYIKGKFIEVGAGKGGLAFFYEKFLNNITLLEPEKKLFKILKKKFKKKKFKIKNTTIEKIKNKFDTILYYDVLEHIKNELSEINNAKKKLNLDGHLIINVPAFQIFYSEFDKSVGHYKRYSKKDFKIFEKKQD